MNGWTGLRLWTSEITAISWLLQAQTAGWKPPLGVRFTCVPVRGSLGPVFDRKGYEVFLPTCKSRRQRSDRYVTLELPLFPGYLFCRCAEPHISSVLNTCGVLRVLGTRESPAVVNEEEIRHLATVTRAKLDLQPCAFITSGQKGGFTGGGAVISISRIRQPRQKVVTPDKPPPKPLMCEGNSLG